MAHDPTQVGAGRSTILEPYDAGVEAALAACASLSSPPSFCLVFATTGYDQVALLAGVRSVIGAASLAGCSGEGVISGNCSDERDRVVTVMAVASTSIRFSVESRPDYATDAERCARALARSLRADGADDLAGVILLVDGITGDCSSFLAVMQEELPAHTVVVGGCAGDDMSFSRTYQYAGDQVLSGGVSAVALRGSAKLQVAVSHGCSPIGLAHTVTAERDGWLLELDGRPAWSVFKEYLEGDAQDLHAEGIMHLSLGVPLGPRQLGDDARFIIRMPMQLEPATGALFFPGGGLSAGAQVRIMRRDQDQIRHSAEDCAARLAQPNPPVFVLQFDCAGRGRVMFGNCASQEIVAPLQRLLGQAGAWLGLHTYGEIAAVGEHLHYHNYTVALCAVYE
ncbi:MAG: FIST C-terminal domain-containing protein [Myxococcales bacterium]|nr:FIST C-terminal domain-containing protein [Myxococcales bacterium]